MSELDKLMAEFEKEVIDCSKAKSLEALQEAYTNSNSMREEILTYIENNYTDEEKYEEAKKFLTREGELLFEYSLEGGTHRPSIPIFDEALDEVDLFEEHESYFQRYGCLSVDWIISWDDSNILFHDIDSDLIEIIRRPDVLMQGSV